jgi:hypothetical protein
LISGSGERFPALSVRHGKYIVLVRDLGHNLVEISFHIPLTAEYVKGFSSMPEDLKKRLTIELTKMLLSRERTGHYSIPLERHILESDEIRLVQKIVLSEKSAATYQRFLDGVQEIVTLGVNVLLLFSALGKKEDDDGPEGSSSTAPTVMYG